MNSQTNLQAYRSVERHSMAESENPHAMISVLFDEAASPHEQFQRQSGR